MCGRSFSPIHRQFPSIIYARFCIIFLCFAKGRLVEDSAGYGPRAWWLRVTCRRSSGTESLLTYSLLEFDTTQDGHPKGILAGEPGGSILASFQDCHGWWGYQGINWTRECLFGSWLILSLLALEFWSSNLMCDLQKAGCWFSLMPILWLLGLLFPHCCVAIRYEPG